MTIDIAFPYARGAGQPLIFQSIINVCGKKQTTRPKSGGACKEALGFRGLSSTSLLLSDKGRLFWRQPFYETQAAVLLLACFISRKCECLLPRR